jgi:methyl-accepting chemotaxis protein
VDLLQKLLARASFRSHLVALGAAVLALASLFLFWFFPARMQQAAVEGAEQRATALSAVMASAVAPGLEFDDARMVGDLLAGLQSAGDVRYAAVWKADGAALATWGPGGKAPEGLRAPEGGAPAGSLLRHEGDTLHVLQPVVAVGGERGVLGVGFSLERVARARSAAVGSAALALGLVFAAGLAALFGAGTVLVRPVRHMRDVALRIAGGDLAGAEAELGGRERVQRMAEGAGGAGRGAGAGGARSSNEVRQLAGAFAQMLVSLRDTSSTLNDSSGILTGSVAHLTRISGEHRQTISRQAAALQQTQVTAEEIKQTSVLASQKAEAVMQVAERAERVSRAGEEAISRSLEGLTAMRQRVEDMAHKVAELGERTRQIGSITQTVKDLADQSNMLALNAAIEAVRSGEHGKGFGVVAREIRTLADQSIHSTDRVREILEDISAAVQAAVASAQEGVKQVEAGAEQVGVSGENLRELSGIVRDNADAVRQISTAVNQQNAGFAQIFTAVTELSGMMSETVRGIDATHEAGGRLEEVSGRITRVAASYRL